MYKKTENDILSRKDKTKLTKQIHNATTKNKKRFSNTHNVTVLWMLIV